MIERETGRTGRNSERVTHDAAGNQTDKRESGANNPRRSGENGTGGLETSRARLSGKTILAKRKRQADGARGNGKTVRMGGKGRAGSAQRDGKPG